MQRTKLKDKVEYCLREWAQCRNSDKLLILCVWSTFHEDKIFGEKGSRAIRLKDVMELPAPESIRRTRQKFQEEGYYPPTDPKVAAERMRKFKRITQAAPVGVDELAHELE